MGAFQGFLRGFTDTSGELLKDEAKAKAEANASAAAYSERIKMDAAIKAQTEQAAADKTSAALKEALKGADGSDVKTPFTPATDPSATAVQGAQATAPAAPVAPTASASSAPAGTPIDQKVNTVMQAATSQGATAAPGQINSLDDKLATYNGPPHKDGGYATVDPNGPNQVAPPVTGYTPDDATAAATLLNEKFKDRPSMITTVAIQAEARKIAEKRTEDTDKKKNEDLKLKADLYTKGMDAEGRPIAGNDPDPDVAKQLGVPVANPELNPNRTMLPKDASRLLREQVKEADKVASAAVDTAHTVENLSNRFEELNKETPTGGVYNLIGGLRKNFDGDYQTLVSLNKQLAVDAKKPGFPVRALGEVQLLLAAAQNPNNTKEANAKIAASLRAEANMIKEEAIFKKNYLLANKQNATVEQEWDKYITDNPVINADLSPNTSRLSPKEYFYGDHAAILQQREKQKFMESRDAITSGSELPKTGNPTLDKLLSQ